MSRANPIREWDAHLRIGLTRPEVVALAHGQMPATVAAALTDEARDLLDTMRRNGTHRTEDTPELFTDAV